MQAIQLKLIATPDDTQVHRCQAFAVLVASADEENGRQMLIDQVSTLATDDSLRGGAIYPLPRSGQDIAAQGLAWIALDPKQAVPCPAGAVALRRAAPHIDLWIPWFSSLAPRVEAMALSRKIAGRDLIQVWLPSSGLVGFDQDDRLQVSDWLAVPSRDVPGPVWKTPVEVWTPPTRLSELSLLTPPTADSFLHDVQDQIGAPPHSLAESDDTGEGRDTRVTGRIKRWLLGKLDQLSTGSESTSADSSPESSSGAAGQVSGASGGAGTGRQAGRGSLAFGVSAKMAAMMSQMMQGERDRQIEKLLNMMKANPDQALKYAIPLAGEAQGFRGFAMPGSALFKRLTDFSLGGLFGGDAGPADFWSIDHRLQLELQKRYREQANRELALGRYRRAAYIFAHLLGDYRAAADALVSGKFFAEAAVLYQDKLKEKRLAASCLARGGMHRQAVEILVSMNLFEEAGVVWLDAGETERARELFWNAYHNAKSRGMPIQAAHLLNDRLGERQRAIDLLCDQWPHGTDAAIACELAIDWLGEDGRHDETETLLKRMSEGAGQSHRSSFAQLAAKIANSYPDHNVRISAEDHCRVTVARVLQSSSPMERGTVLTTLGQMLPDDPQLARDAQAYDHWTERRQSKTVAKRVAKENVVRLPPVVSPEEGTFLDYRVLGERWFGIVQVPGRMSLLHCDNLREFNIKPVASCPFQTSLGELPEGYLLIGNALVESGQLAVEVYAPMGVLKESLHETADPQDVVMKLLSLRDTAAVAIGTDTRWTISREPDALVLRDSRGQTYDISGEAFDQQETLCLTAAGNVPIWASSTDAFLLREDNVHHLCKTAPVLDLAASLRHTRARVAIAHAEGLDVMPLNGGDLVSVAIEPRGFQHCLWAPGGVLIAASDKRLHFFKVCGEKIPRIAEVTLPHPPDANIVKLFRLVPGTIGVGYSNGHIERYRVS